MHNYIVFYNIITPFYLHDFLCIICLALDDSDTMSTSTVRKQIDMSVQIQSLILIKFIAQHCVEWHEYIHIELSVASPYEICMWTILYITCTKTSVVECPDDQLLYFVLKTEHTIFQFANCFSTRMLFLVDTNTIWLQACQKYEAFKMTYFLRYMPI
jgi:hypothetical protein